MNRIVLIGNGYDLSYNLRTTYQNFIIDLVNRACNDPSKYEKIIKVTDNFDGNRTELFDSINTIEDIKNSESFIIGMINDPIPLGKSSCHFMIYFNSKFISNLLEVNNWADIEGYYFESLLKTYFKYQATEDLIEVKILNNEFNTLKEYFYQYIRDINQLVHNLPSTDEHYKFIKSCLHDFGEREYYSDPRNPSTEPKSEVKIEELLFVNFNYTSVLPNNTGYLPSGSYECISIHGQVNDKKSNLIFGYGDDTHEDYKKLEQSGIDDFLVNMKAFHYFFNESYKKLISFLELDEYEIFVVGHSMGLSDRVLLKSIFEHDKCKAIRLFHRGNERSYFNKILALSRHFDNKEQMRNKIIRYNSKDTINQ